MTGLKSCVLWLLSLQRSRGQGSAVLGGWVGVVVGAGAVKGGSFGYRLQEKRMEAELTQLQAKVLGETLREISFLSPTWEHPMDIHVGPEAATPPQHTRTHSPQPTHPPSFSASLSLFSPTSSLQHAHLLPHNRCYV